MKQCVVCGRKGLFLKLDESGKCNECVRKEKEEALELERQHTREKAIEEEKKRQEEEAAEAARFDAYFSSLLSRFKDINVANFADDPIQALESIPALRDKIKVCDTLKEEFSNSLYKKELGEKLLSMITCSDFDRRLGIGTIEDFDVRVHSGSNGFSAADVFSAINGDIDSCKDGLSRIISTIQRNADYQRLLDSIPLANIEITNTKHKTQSVGDLEELVKYSSITAKTNPDKIGNFVVIDTETTGLSPSRDALVEVAAVRFEGWKPVEKFTTLINPGKKISPSASAINGITDAMVADAPSFDQIIDSLDSFVGKSNLVGHNISFDLKFLYRHGYNFTSSKRHYYDTCAISKKVLKKQKAKWDREIEEYVVDDDDYDYDVENYKLTTLCNYYKIRDDMFAHRALSDALATGILFKLLAQKWIDI